MQSHSKLFGTDGIRELFGKFPMTSEAAFLIGKSCTAICHDDNLKLSEKKICYIAWDTRESSEILAYSLASGILQANIDCLLCGVLPTPALAYLIKNSDATLGIMVTASHNPYYYNGFKFFNKNGDKISTEEQNNLEKKIYELRESKKNSKDNCCANKTENKIEREVSAKLSENFGKIVNKKKITLDYIELLYKNFTNLFDVNDAKMHNFSVLIDAANGATSKIAETVFAKTNLHFDIICNNPDGKNINTNCGCTDLSTLKKDISNHKEKFKNSKEHIIGIAFDGDGDRVIMLDEEGEVVDGDHILAICAKYFSQKNVLKNKALVATEVSTIGLGELMENLGGKLISTAVGDANVAKAMREHNSNLGGESSGHIIFGDYLSCGDGILTSMQVLSIMLATNKSLSELKKNLTIYPKISRNIKLVKKIPLEELKASKLISKIKNEMANNGKFIIRYSGTEPLIRIYLEGKDEKQLKSFADKLVQEIKSEIGV